MKIVTVVGARPQFIKAAVVSHVLRMQHTEILVHTGQHFDYNMSEQFFKELDIPNPDYNLGISGGTHVQMTGRMMIAIEEVLIKEKPDWATDDEELEEEEMEYKIVGFEDIDFFF